MRPYLYFILVAAFMLAYAASVEARGLSKQEETTLHAYSKAQGIDPDLALAVIEVESNFRREAVGALGERGYFQLRPEFHGAAVTNPTDNLRIGLVYLASVRARCTADYGPAWFLCFNHGPSRRLKKPLASDYYRRVSAVYKARKLQNTKPANQRLFEVVPYVGN